MGTEIFTSPHPVSDCRISIIIPTLNRAEVLLEALQAMRKQTLDKFELIVVDNGPSIDQTRQYVMDLMKEDDRIIYISTDEKGISVARNIGCHYAKTGLLLVTDDDWEMTDPDTLVYIVSCFQTDPQLGVLGISAEMSKDLSQIKSYNRLKYLFERLIYRPGMINRWGQVTAKFQYLDTGRRFIVDHVRGCCMAFRKHPAAEAGYFSTVYGNGIGFRDETDLCRRIANQGYKIIYSTEITGKHKSAPRPSNIAPRTMNRRKMYDFARNHHLFILRNYWSRNTAFVFLVFDLIIGNKSQPGIVQLLLNPKYFLNFRLVLSALQGKLVGYSEYLNSPKQ